jgi:hypothetical protein
VSPHRIRIGEIQHSALSIFVLDPAVNVVLFDDDALFPGSLEDEHLIVERGQEALAHRLIVDGANSADAMTDDPEVGAQDRALRDALTAVGRRVRSTRART